MGRIKNILFQFLCDLVSRLFFPFSSECIAVLHSMLKTELFLSIPDTMSVTHQKKGIIKFNQDFFFLEGGDKKSNNIYKGLFSSLSFLKICLLTKKYRKKFETVLNP